jgi:hypothetical protein
VRAGNKVLMELEDNCAPIVDDLQGISGQQLRPRPIQSLNIIIIIIIIIIKFNY